MPRHHRFVSTTICLPVYRLTNNSDGGQVRLAMFLGISRPQLKSIFRSSLCSCRSTLRLCSRDLKTNISMHLSRPAATKPSSSAAPRPKPSAPKKPLSAAISPSLAPHAAQVQDARRNLLAQNLARGGKMVLFQAPSHVAFMCTAWMAGTISFGGALIILNQRLYEANEHLPWFVPSAYRIVAVFLLALGGWAVLRPSRLISSIEILPVNNKAHLLFKIRRNIPLPFIKPRQMTVAVSDVIVGRRVVADMAQPPPAAGSSGKGISKGVSFWFFRLFTGARQFIFFEGIIKLGFKGHGGIWKLDTNGLFSDGGRLFQMIKFED